MHVRLFRENLAGHFHKINKKTIITTLAAPLNEKQTLDFPIREMFSVTQVKPEKAFSHMYDKSFRPLLIKQTYK